MTDRERVLAALSDEWQTTSGIMRAIRESGSRAKHLRVSELLAKLSRKGLAERRLGGDGPNGYRQKLWRKTL